MKRYIFMLTFLLTLTTWVYAQLVDIPDPGLRTAVRSALNLPDDVPLTQASMRLLNELEAADRQIERLTGLEYATNLTRLSLVFNNISDLTPLAGLRLKELWLWDNLVTDLSPLFNMTTLTHLDLGFNRISDISRLKNLTRLTWLELSGNQISDITPLSNLTQLTLLEAFSNQITNVTPLANLTRLEHLKIQGNGIIDHSPLDGLALTLFEYDQTCDMPPLSLQSRLENRSFPSLVNQWGFPLVNKAHLSEVEQIAKHNLYFCCLGMFNQQFFDTGDGWLVRGGDLDASIQMRDDYLTHNPNMIFMAVVNAVWEGLDVFPEDSPYWLRDDAGKILRAWEAGLVDLNHPDVQKRIVERAVALEMRAVRRHHL